MDRRPHDPPPLPAGIRGSPPDGPALDRRALMLGSAVAVAGASLAAGMAFPVAGQSATPMASPARADGDLLWRVSVRLAGTDALDDDALPVLVDLAGDDPALGEIAGIDIFTPEAMEELSDPARALASNILQFWYLGNWNGQPVPNRADTYLGLVVWSALPYATQPTVCKRYGYWSDDV